MLIDRNDGIIDLCEMKYSESEYAISAWIFLYIYDTSL